MSSRHEILSRLQRRPIPAVELPGLDHERQTFDDLTSKFAETLKAVGGEAVIVPDVAAANAQLAKLATYNAATRTVSLAEGVGDPTVDPEALDRPHELEDVEYAILPGRFGVAENAAVWLDLRDVKHRVICVLAQHLAVVLPASEIVPTMHEAYARLSRTGGADADFVERPGYGLFLSGPSKTADIEQSLVIGAHGARSLTVFLIAKSA